MLLTLSRRLAFAFGVLIPIGETIRRWGVWGYPPAWLDDYFIGAFLVAAAIVSHRDAARGRDPARGRAWLAGAWGFTAGMGYASFFGHLERIDQPDPGNIPQVWLTSIIGAGWLVVLAALAATLTCRVSGARPEGAADGQTQPPRPPRSPR